VTGRALVTGASGFVGPHLVRRLLADGWQTAVLTRSSSRLPADLADRCTRLVSDAGWDLVDRQLRESAPDVCFHLATHFVATHQPADVGPLVAANVHLGARLLESLSAAGRTTFVNVGTVWQHHGGRPYAPTSLYAATKQAFGAVVQYYAECREVPAVTVELADTYGLGDRRGKLLQSLVRATVTGVPLGLSPGHQVVDLTHVDDVVDGLLTAAGVASTAAPVFSVHGTVLTVRDLVALVGELLGSPVPVDWGARPYRTREMMAPWLHTPVLPGWRPAVSLRSGLPAVLADLVADAGQSPPR
jgi:nucleoside-diphosphate-sugar epimerase